MPKVKLIKAVTVHYTKVVDLPDRLEKAAEGWGTQEEMDDFEKLCDFWDALPIDVWQAEEVETWRWFDDCIEEWEILPETSP